MVKQRVMAHGPLHCDGRRGFPQLALCQDQLNTRCISLCRTGICLPFVCRDFRDALQDLQHVQLWGNVAPLRCTRDHVYSVKPSTICES